MWRRGRKNKQNAKVIGSTGMDRRPRVLALAATVAERAGRTVAPGKDAEFRTHTVNIGVIPYQKREIKRKERRRKERKKSKQNKNKYAPLPDQ